jgi:hypothetical protein
MDSRSGTLLCARRRRSQQRFYQDSDFLSSPRGIENNQYPAGENVCTDLSNPSVAYQCRLDPEPGWLATVQAFDFKPGSALYLRVNNMHSPGRPILPN